jgi:DNA primase large subunit
MTELTIKITKDELRRLIDEALEEKLVEFFGDPDEGLELRDDLKQRLLRQKEATAKGERGKPLSDVVKELGL